MTHREYIQQRLEHARQTFGDNALSVKALEQQLRSMAAKPKSAAAMFVLGGRGSGGPPQFTGRKLTFDPSQAGQRFDRQTQEVVGAKFPNSADRSRRKPLSSAGGWDILPDGHKGAIFSSQHLQSLES